MYFVVVPRMTCVSLNDKPRIVEEGGNLKKKYLLCL